MISLPREFELIARYFRPLAGPDALRLTDDAALMTPPPGQVLVLTADAMVENVHFLPDQPPDLVARKLLRTNLSDLAAMGAAPLGYLLTMAIRRDTAQDWIAAFTAGLAMDQAEFGVALLGGDSTSIAGPACLSITMIGHAPPDGTVRRSGARSGDGIWVTGTIGDAALGLAVLRGELPADPQGWLRHRYDLPIPRLGLPIASFASACLDISDGLVQDLGHLCRAGNLGAMVEAAAVPLSVAARQAGPAWRQRILTGGDDYELLLAVPPEREAILLAAQRQGRLGGVTLTRIGRFVAGEVAVMVRDEAGETLPMTDGGWSHF